MMTFRFAARTYAGLGTTLVVLLVAVLCGARSERASSAAPVFPASASDGARIVQHTLPPAAMLEVRPPRVPEAVEQERPRPGPEASGQQGDRNGNASLRTLLRSGRSPATTSLVSPRLRRGLLQVYRC